MQATRTSTISGDLSISDPENDETRDERLAWSSRRITTSSLATCRPASAIAPGLALAGFDRLCCSGLTRFYTVRPGAEAKR
ncbi:hypothetical protein [Agrococcus sp. Ld7]|uniref:hypothetical protein n=1 Tax=Agrococcus sp. Ld7 TaxID=649148 RepID=UPI003870362E